MAAVMEEGDSEIPVSEKPTYQDLGLSMRKTLIEFNGVSGDD
jgi:hypothetical protein